MSIFGADFIRAEWRYIIVGVTYLHCRRPLEFFQYGRMKFRPVSGMRRRGRSPLRETAPSFLNTKLYFFLRKQPEVDRRKGMH